MRNRDFFLPSVTTLILFGLVWFLSCAHQNRWQDETGTQYDEVAQAEAEEAQEGTQDVAVNETSPSPESEKLETESSSQTQNQESDWDGAQTQSLTPEQQEQLKAELNQTSSESEAQPEAVAENQTNESAETAQAEPVTSSPIEEQPAKPKRLFIGKLPVIPNKAFAKKGFKLNRFYFVRKGDTPKKVSSLIYSDSKYGKKLTAWNGKNWQPGKVLFYASNINPEDSSMRSFYQERNITPEEYRVKNGDWLTRIAHKKLGSVFSWKEVAVVNGLKKPGAIEVGQLLAIYPKNLSAAPMVAKNEESSYRRQDYAPEEVPAPRQAPVVPQQRAEAPQADVRPANPPAQFEAPAVNPEPRETEEQVPSKEVASAPTNWEQVVEQNSVAIFIGLTLIVLLLALSARKKRAKNRAQNSGDSDSENYSQTTQGQFGKRR